MTNVDEKIVNELLSNEKFLSDAKNVKSAEDFTLVLRDYGVDVEASDVSQAMELVSSHGELSEDSLESVAGGFVIKGPIYWIGYLFGKLITKSGC